MTARKLVWPLSRTAGKLATHEQDSLQDVAQCVAILTRTRLGDRPLVPEIGFEDPTGTDGADPSIGAQLTKWEPRARVEVSVETSTDGRQQTRKVTVSLIDDPDPTEA